MNGAAGNGGDSVVVAAEEGPQDHAGNPTLAVEAAGGRQNGGGPLQHAPNFDAGTLLVVVTLISALSYQLGTNIPAGRVLAGRRRRRGGVAGDPIMRDKHRRRYWLFMAASWRWVAFGTSMLLTVGLLTGSRFVRAAFLVAYSGHVLTFVTSQPRTSLAMENWVLL